MARPSCRGYVAQGRGEVHPLFRTSDLVLIRELLLSLVELLLLPFQSFQPRKFLLIPELLLLLQLQLPLLLLALRELLLLLLKELLLLLLLELLMLQELLPTYSFEFVPWRGRSLLGEITQGVCIPRGALVAIECTVP